MTDTTTGYSCQRCRAECDPQPDGYPWDRLCVRCSTLPLTTPAGQFMTSGAVPYRFHWRGGDTGHTTIKGSGK